MCCGVLTEHNCLFCSVRVLSLSSILVRINRHSNKEYMTTEDLVSFLEVEQGVNTKNLIFRKDIRHRL